MYTYIPYPLPCASPSLSPLQVVTKHQADLPVLCGCFPLAIYFTFGSVYMSMPLSHFVPAYPSHSPYPQVHSLSLRFYSCPAPRFFRTIFFFFQIPYICVSIWVFFLFLTSLCMTDSRSIHLTTNNSVSFLFMANIPLYICATSSLPIHLSVDTQVASMSCLL